MNTDNGRIYRNAEAIEAARARGEPLAEVSEQVADTVEIGMLALNRAQRRVQQREARRRAKRQRREG